MVCGLQGPSSDKRQLNGPLSRRAPQAKKHKTWEGDGVLVVTRPKAALMDLEGRMYASDCPLLCLQVNIGILDLQSGKLAPIYSRVASN